jgi:prepilin-type N-terminal cleavage/methylation domain-containing protein
MNRRGLTLLEVMVALVILGIVGVAILEVFGGSARAAASTGAWAQAVAYAEDAMERTKLLPLSRPGTLSSTESLPGDFERWVETEQWAPGVHQVTVVVTLPDGGKFELSRLVRGP